MTETTEIKYEIRDKNIRLEDIVYMTDQGPRWFTQPAGTVEKPF